MGTCERDKRNAVYKETRDARSSSPIENRLLSSGDVSRSSPGAGEHWLGTKGIDRRSKVVRHDASYDAFTSC